VFLVVAGCVVVGVICGLVAFDDGFVWVCWVCVFLCGVRFLEWVWLWGSCSL